MKRTKLRLGICITLLTLVLAFIWGNSCLPGETSGAFSAWLKDLLASLFGWETSDADPGGHGLLRKAAHFTEFCWLGLCLSWLTYMLCVNKRRAVLIAVAAGFAAACIDECIQIFVPGRGPGLMDVGIDSLGVVFGICILSLKPFIKHGRTKHLEENKS